MGFCTFPHLLYNFCEKCGAFQAFALVVPSPGRQGLPGCMERIQLLLAVSSQKPKRNWLMIGLSRENKKTGNDRQLFSPCAHQLCSLTSVQKPLYPSLHPISYISVYVKLHVYMCGSIAKTHSQSLEKDFSSEEFSLQGEPGLSFSKLSAHLGADFLFLSSLSTSDRGPWPLPGPCYWKFPTWKQQGQHAIHQGLCPPC